jgi:hypothetical protein
LIDGALSFELPPITEQRELPRRGFVRWVDTRKEDFKTGCQLRINGAMLPLKRCHVRRAGLVNQVGAILWFYRVMVILHRCAVYCSDPLCRGSVSSFVARASSSGVSSPCFASQSSRKAPSASDRSFAEAPLAATAGALFFRIAFVCGVIL